MRYHERVVLPDLTANSILFTATIYGPLTPSRSLSCKISLVYYDWNSPISTSVIYLPCLCRGRCSLGSHAGDNPHTVHVSLNSLESNKNTHYTHFHACTYIVQGTRPGWSSITCSCRMNPPSSRDSMARWLKRKCTAASTPQSSTPANHVC